ncbi:MAG: aspartate ammonia-lyase [bacterium]
MARIERDSLGEMPVPDTVYWGVQTARAIENFPVSGERVPQELIRAYAFIKRCAADTNRELGTLDAERADAIARACDEIVDGKLVDQFPTDAFQAGAGTSTNMNLNEVIANRALELLGRERGDYAFLSPNDHVNLAQSSNDTYPTAVHIAVMTASDALLAALGNLSAALRAKAEEFSGVAKPGRTHLMDALPVTLGDEFGAWASSVERASERVEQRRDDLGELAIGGTAVGTGVGAAPGFRDAVIARLGGMTGLNLRPCRDSFEALQSRAALGAFSGALRELALELGRIANDLRLLASGPVAGLAEIRLPAVQPGSSIMPGKVNPSLAECLNMVCFVVVGNDAAVALAVGAGQLELNVFTPLMARNILQSVRMLVSFLPAFTDKCVAGITADEARCRASLAQNPSLATLLVPRIGYLKAAELAKESLARRVPVADLAVEKGILTRAEAEALFGRDGTGSQPTAHG